MILGRTLLCWCHICASTLLDQQERDTAAYVYVLPEVALFIRPQRVRYRNLPVWSYFKKWQHRRNKKIFENFIFREELSHAVSSLTSSELIPTVVDDALGQTGLQCLKMHHTRVMSTLLMLCFFCCHFSTWQPYVSTVWNSFYMGQTETLNGLEKFQSLRWFKEQDLDEISVRCELWKRRRGMMVIHGIKQLRH